MGNKKLLTCKPLRAKETNLVLLVSKAILKGLKQTALSSYAGVLNNPVHCEFNKSVMI